MRENSHRMSTKSYLKSCKAALDRGNPQLAIEWAADAIEEDPQCVLAYLLRGKAYMMVSEHDKAIADFKTATALEPDNLTAWKGYLQAQTNVSDISEYLNVATGYLRVQAAQGDRLYDTYKQMRTYLQKNSYKSDKAKYQQFLRAVKPGTELGELLGREFGHPEDNLRQLVDLVKAAEDGAVRTKVAKTKMAMGRNLTPEQELKVDAAAWSIRQHSDLRSLYNEYISICSDDALRRQYENALLEYVYELQRISPDKPALREEVYAMAEGMVVVGVANSLAWTIYLDWLDVRDFSQLDHSRLLECVQLFRRKGLGLVVAAFLLSDLSPFGHADSKKLLAMCKQSKKTDDDESMLEEELGARSHEVLSTLLAGYSRCKSSLFATRVLCAFQIQMGDYTSATDMCRKAVTQLATLKRTRGIDLENTRHDILCSLAMAYTYHEAPKNFPRALELYDRILEANPNNHKALVGKGLILMEKGDLEGARAMLLDVVAANPNNHEAIRELGWCEIRMGQLADGRARLQAVFELLGHEVRSLVRWRIAKSYLLEDNVDAAYAELIATLKETKNHAASYSLLGDIYRVHYDDATRAQRCYYRAFELDASEIGAARCLVEDFASRDEWEVADILCQRVVTVDAARRRLFSAETAHEDRSWPYRVLGCSALNRQDDAKAVEWFQSALRMKAMDVECWIGLGEAYYNCGRLDAAAKVFGHVLTIRSQWVVKLLLGKVQCEMGEFVVGLGLIHDALAEKPAEECVLIALFENHLAYAQNLVTNGFYGRACDNIVETLQFIRQTFAINRSSQTLWRCLNDGLRFFTTVQEKIAEFPEDVVSPLFDDISPSEYFDFSAKDAHSLCADPDTLVEGLSQYGVLASQMAVTMLPSKVSRHLRTVTVYNLGLSLLEAFNNTHNTKYRDGAVAALKKAVQLENNNSSFWISLGNAYVSFRPHLAQHCFIKASTLDSRDGEVYTNLAALYLRYGDFALAQEAFLRSQSIAPQHSHPWVGHALAAQSQGDHEAAFRLFTHAYTISNGRSALVQLLYGLLIVDKRVKITGSQPHDIDAAQEFSIANYAMQKYLQFRPNDVEGLRTALVISERCQQYDTELGTRLCNLLERKYEALELDSVLVDYAVARTQLARMYLGAEDYERAIENAQTTLDVLSEETNPTREMTAAMLSSRVVIGLSFFFNNQFDEALDELKAILEAHSDLARLVSLTAQILWTYGDSDTRQAALDQLFGYIEEFGSSLVVVLTLGAISVVDDLHEYLDPIKDELKGLTIDETLHDTSKAVPALIDEINKRINVSSKVWQKNAMLFPSDYAVWKHLNTRMALTVASLPENKQTASQLSDALVDVGNVRAAQRALLLDPSSHAAHQAIASIN